MRWGSVNTTNGRPFAHRGGFTLIEASLALIIVGVGVLAVLQLFGAVSELNLASQRMHVAMNLAQNINERMAALPFNDPHDGFTVYGPEADEPTPADWNDVDDFRNSSFNPPRDSMMAPIPELANYTQVVDMQAVKWDVLNGNLNGDDDAMNRADDEHCLRVTIRVLYSPPGRASRELYKMTTVRALGS